MLLSDVINLNRAFPQLVKSYFEGFFIKKCYQTKKNWIACFFEQKVTLEYRKNVELFTFYSPTLNYKCILPDHIYFTGIGQRTKNKLMIVSLISVVKLLQIFFSVICQCVSLHKCSITFCKCNTTWVLSLYNTRCLNARIDQESVYQPQKMKYVAGLQYFLL